MLVCVCAHPCVELTEQKLPQRWRSQRDVNAPPSQPLGCYQGLSLVVLKGQLLGALSRSKLGLKIFRAAWGIRVPDSPSCILSQALPCVTNSILDNARWIHFLKSIPFSSLMPEVCHFVLHLLGQGFSLIYFKSVSLPCSLAQGVLILLWKKMFIKRKWKQHC